MSVETTVELPAVPEPRDEHSALCDVWRDSSEPLPCTCRDHIMWCDRMPPCGCERRVAP